MADEFDILDIVTITVENAGTGLQVYQGNSPENEKKEHIVVNALPYNELEQVGKVDVNVNIFTKKHDNGSPDISRQSSVKRIVRKALDKIRHPVEMYWDSTVLWSERLYDVKQGFDCMNIRLEIITEKN
ncbi:hypothetical protein DWW69_09645 [Bacteroides sp. AF16-49]|uniref:hypothetical protein n=1 Tax=Bacteroides sp. AF16-49 TaxID=2292192 RepID=UPI000EFF104E|nr:hypothetical protein [Bacteroides sp. AF16-49]RHR75543.1 hypothetical protein DWW69_09645 [Bacteroides sp. AF16-49]